MSIKLSICIPTLNRAKYIGETLDSIVPQLQQNVELIIVDGGSKDDTAEIVNSYIKPGLNIRLLFSQKPGDMPSNQGFDRDCDHAASEAAGEYCWLMTDDDIVLAGAVERILSEIKKGYSLIVASTEIRNHDLSEVITPKRPDTIEDKVYGKNEIDKFAIDCCAHLTFVGAVIIKRECWLAVDRTKYYGSGFIHVGVILDRQLHESILVISDPLVIIRYGNAHWTSRTFQIWMVNWPDLIWSSAVIGEATKRAIVKRSPWRSLRTLMAQRALGNYSVAEYNEFVKNNLKSTFNKVLLWLVAVSPQKPLACLFKFYNLIKRCRTA